MDEEHACLAAAYCATTYRIAAPGGPLDLRVGAAEPALDALLESLGVSSWAFVSAANPRSRPAAPADNERAHAALLMRVRAAGWHVLEGVGLPDAGWAPERSLFVAGIPRAQALRLAREFGQNAIVCGAIGSPAELAWLA